MIKPFSFFIIKLCTAFTAFLQREKPDELIHRHDLLVIPGIPAQQCQEIYDSFGQISRLAISGRNFSRLRIVPLQRKNRKSQTVSVALTQLFLSRPVSAAKANERISASYPPTRKPCIARHATEPKAAIPPPGSHEKLPSDDHPQY